MTWVGDIRHNKYISFAPNVSKMKGFTAFCCNLESFLHLQCLQYRIALIFHRAKCWPISQIGQLLCRIFWETLCFLSDRWLGWHSIYDNFSRNFLFQSKVCSTKLSCYTACHCLHHANTALTSYCEQSLTAHYYCIIITITFITVGLFFRMDFIFRNWHTYEN